MIRDAERILSMVAALKRRDQALLGVAEGEPPMADLQAVLLDATRVLEQVGVPHALVGGLAVILHVGEVRATRDVDIAVISSADLGAVARAFEVAGFEVGKRFEHTLNLRHACGEPVQLTFDGAMDAPIARAVPVPVGRGAVRIVTREDLILLKERAAADPRRRKSKALRDRSDVELLRGDVPDPEEGW